MKKTFSLIATLIITMQLASAQITPDVSSWIRNTTSATGYNGILSNVQIVQYSTNNVYVSCTCIPGYSIGPWTGNPNTPSNQNFVFKITRNPAQNTGTTTAVGLGHIGVWTNGVSVFNVSDAQSYNNAGVWFRNAYYWEGPGFDNCLGHPQQQGEYHHHVSPTCLYNEADSLNHSPIIGYAFDGFPIYGAYAYTNTTGTGAIKRMESSYVLSTSTTRVNGPAVGGMYPNGCFIGDYIYTAGSGDLDVRNGRFCVTPEYPNGTYCYFVTIDVALNPVFPYTFYGTYYGVVQAGNTGMGSGHNTISEPTTIYNGSVGIDEVASQIKFQLTPNPVTDYAFIYFDPSSANNVTGEIYDGSGKLLFTQDNLQPSISYTFDFTKYASGNYFMHFTSGNQKVVQKIVKVK
ncbi:MAG: YHYH protein [Bacteroidia bacterium]